MISVRIFILGAFIGSSACASFKDDYQNANDFSKDKSEDLTFIMHEKNTLLSLRSNNIDALLEKLSLQISSDKKLLVAAELLAALSPQQKTVVLRQNQQSANAAANKSAAAPAATLSTTMDKSTTDQKSSK